MRPARWIFTPPAPIDIDVSAALRIVLRNGARFWSCSAIASATSCDSSSGFSISWILRSIRFPIISSSCFVSSSTLLPRFPMMRPGLAVWIVIRTASRLRSISIIEMSPSFVAPRTSAAKG